MQQTTNLHLNLFEPDDPVLAENLNANTRTLDGMPQAVCGSYTGSGTYNAAGARTLNFPRKPLLVVITGLNYMVLGIRGNSRMITANIMPGATSTSKNLTCTWNARGITYYADSAADMANYEGATYSYFAILGEA